MAGLSAAAEMWQAPFYVYFMALGDIGSRNLANRQTWVQGEVQAVADRRLLVQVRWLAGITMRSVCSSSRHDNRAATAASGHLFDGHVHPAGLSLQEREDRLRIEVGFGGDNVHGFPDAGQHFAVVDTHDKLVVSRRGQ